MRRPVMIGTLKYKSFSANVEFDWFNLAYVGHVPDSDQAIRFRGSTLEEAEQDFRRAVNKHLTLSRVTDPATSSAR